MGLFDKGVERRRQEASEVLNGSLHEGETVVALLPWSVYYPPEDLGVLEQVHRRTSPGAAAKAGAGRPRALAVTTERLVALDYPAASSAAELVKGIFKGGFESTQESPRIAASYPRSDVSVLEWPEGGKVNRDLALEVGVGEALRFKIGKAFWDEAESVVAALGGTRGSAQG